MTNQGSKRSKPHPSATIATIWDLGIDLSEETLEQLPVQQQAVYHGPSSMAISFTHVSIRGTSYRVEASDTRRKTQDCGLAALFLSKTAKGRLQHNKRFGKLQKVLSIAVAGCQQVLLFMSWFQDAQADPRFRGGSLVRVDGKQPIYWTYDTVIEASKVTEQVFFADDPQKIGWQHVFQCRPSSFKLLPHFFNDDGRLLNIDS